MDLAYNINGEAFDVPESATGWRVRRMKPRGAPEVVYGKDGIPLIVPIDSDLAELRRNVDAPGRFRLDAVDDRGRTIEDSPAAYLMVSSTIDADDDGVTTLTKVPVRDDEDPIREAMRLNTELARSVIDRFPEMMHAAAELLRAADGAGLPRREPRGVLESDEADVDDDAPTPPASASFELINTLVAQIVPMIVTSFTSKKGPKLGSILDWRKAVPEKTVSEPTAEAPAQTEAKTQNSDAVEPPPLDPKAMSHFVAIQSALTPAEAALARQVAAELSPAELRAWFGELLSLSVPDAVAKIRTFVGSKSGRAS